MRGTYTRLLEAMVALTALVGLLDAIAGEQADLALVFAIALALSLVLVARSAVGRREVAVRRDLAKWLADRAAVEGDTAGAIADSVDEPAPQAVAPSERRKIEGLGAWIDAEGHCTEVANALAEALGLDYHPAESIVD